MKKIILGLIHKLSQLLKNGQTLWYFPHTKKLFYKRSVTGREEV